MEFTTWEELRESHDYGVSASGVVHAHYPHIDEGWHRRIEKVLESPRNIVICTMDKHAIFLPWCGLGFMQPVDLPAELRLCKKCFPDQ